MPRLRTINDALALIKAEDKDTSITYNYIRNLCLKKIIPSYIVGSKILFNYDDLIGFLDVK